MLLQKYWPWLVALLLQGESIWRFIKWILDWRGRYDALAETYHEIGGFGAVIGYILDPPPWFYPVAFLAGVILIGWNFKRNRESNATIQPVAHNQPGRREPTVNSLARPDRIALIELKNIAVEYGWDTNINTSGNLIELVDRLNQAAVDGLIKFWGREYTYDLSEQMKETFPLIEIPRRHFCEGHLFNCINIFIDNANNYRVFTGKITKTMQEQKGHIFRDIYADRRQLIDWLSTNRPRSENTRVAKDKNALQIITGNGDPFDRIDVNKYGVHRTISLAAKNCGSKKIANCYVYRTYVSILDDSDKVLLDGPFSLDSDEMRYVSIAMFNETKDHPDAHHLIGLTMPPAAFGAGIMQPRLTPDRRYILSFLATSPDCRDAVLHCEVSVDDGGKLRCTKL
jgi:hypothetical protein